VRVTSTLNNKGLLETRMEGKRRKTHTGLIPSTCQKGAAKDRDKRGLRFLQSIKSAGRRSRAGTPIVGKGEGRKTESVVSQVENPDLL